MPTGSSIGFVALRLRASVVQSKLDTIAALTLADEDRPELETTPDPHNMRHLAIDPEGP